ncbi:MAG TPA: hypothetical protein VIZ30_00495 [Pseudomonadales bacterium]
MKRLLTLVLAGFGYSAVQAHAEAAYLYRFVNEDGVVVLSNSIPPELVSRGYDVVRGDGTLVRVVPRELTPSELVERDRQLAAEKAAADAGSVRASRDEDLMKLYASPLDVEEARDRKILSIETVVATTKANLERLKLQKRRLEEQAASLEREGGTPSPELLSNLTILETQIAEKEREVAARKLEQQRVSDQFGLDLERIRLLYGLPPAPATDATATSATATSATATTATATSATATTTPP